MRNLLTSAVFEKTFKASDNRTSSWSRPLICAATAKARISSTRRATDPDSDKQMTGNALDFLTEGALIQLHKYNGNPIDLQLPTFVELTVTYVEKPQDVYPTLKYEEPQIFPAHRKAEHKPIGFC